MTWDELAPVDGNLLVVVNSRREDEEAVGRLFDALAASSSLPAPFVIASHAWQDWLAARGVTGDRVLFSLDDAGADLELNHFLESPAAVLWIASKTFGAVVGSEAHGLYNEEVKDIFERRIAFVLGEGRFLAHTLPNPYVFVFDLAGLLERFVRDVKVKEYAQTAGALVDDLYRQWIANGKPALQDTPALDVASVLESRLRSSSKLVADETAAAPSESDGIARALAHFVAHLGGVLVEHDRRLADKSQTVAELVETAKGLQHEVDRRDALLVERTDAMQREINVRDALLAQAHDRYSRTIDARVRAILSRLAGRA
jgi:hypothetical protein